MQGKVEMPTQSFEASGPPDRASLDFLFPQEFETSLDAAVAAMGARFEVRRFFWRERREIAFTPPCSYFEVTRFPSMGRYLASAADFCAQGEVRFYPWARPFQMHWKEREQRSLFCRIDVRALTGLSMELSDRQLRDTIDMRNPHIRALLLRAQQEIMAPGLCSQIILDSISMDWRPKSCSNSARKRDRTSPAAQRWTSVIWPDLSPISENSPARSR
ncbi:hypothetical protein K9B33_03590 [Sphingobium sp. 3R8]|uniref:hypothetical protein n=1 Tax=Sphingobium sp. 3R8 TaxID=2874921 RepID=UPI001CCCDCA0|nr:hypothetical protein [Sphingobium sp. 3R8]MBZ9646618.1 hypothetical protein [Sphingobium sp. 3R8]